jgi:hypothetical protein
MRIMASNNIYLLVFLLFKWTCKLYPSWWWDIPWHPWGIQDKEWKPKVQIWTEALSTEAEEMTQLCTVPASTGELLTSQSNEKY